jgi:hypothetical protein
MPLLQDAAVLSTAGMHLHALCVSARSVCICTLCVYACENPRDYSTAIIVIVVAVIPPSCSACIQILLAWLGRSTLNGDPGVLMAAIAAPFIKLLCIKSFHRQKRKEQIATVIVSLCLVTDGSNKQGL